LVLYKVWQTNINRLIPNAEVHVLGNWIEMREAPDSTEVEQVKRDLGISKENFTVITVGFVGWRKGSYDILDAVPLVVQACDSVRFIFVGGEEYPGEIGPFNERVQNENLGKWVLFTGEVPREKVPGYLACADVFLLPSHREGMPISIIEAMRGGVPIISTLVGAIPEMIENGTSGILINPGAPDEIAEAVLSLKRDDSLRRRLAEGSRRAFEEKYEISKGIHELASVYRSMCSG
jgi:glycosyltransferase involved in cell wall biosynthesis